MLNTKSHIARPKISEHFYRTISLPAQLIALLCDAALAHETLRRALSGSAETTSILVAVAIAMVIVECSSQAASQRAKGEVSASRTLLAVAYGVAAVILVLRVFAGFGSGGQAQSAFAAQGASSSWSGFVTNALVSLLMGACVCASILGVYHTRLAGFRERSRAELVERRSELGARELSREAYDPDLDISAASDFVAAVHERARSIVIARAATLAPEIADVYELSARQASGALAAGTDSSRRHLPEGAAMGGAPSPRMVDAA